MNDLSWQKHANPAFHSTHYTLIYLLDLSVLAVVSPSSPELWHADAYLTSHQVYDVRKKRNRFIHNYRISLFEHRNWLCTRHIIKRNSHKLTLGKNREQFLTKNQF